MTLSHLLRPVLAAAVLAAGLCQPVGAQETADIPGVVVDVATGNGIADVILRLVGTDVSAASDVEGRFVLRGVPGGDWMLRVDHVAYGSHEHRIVVEPGQALAMEIRLAPEAILLEALVVEAETSRVRTERAQGFSLHSVDRRQIERALGTSKHMGDLIRQTVPGIRLRQTNNLAGTDVCLEFRAAATISLLGTRACNHPMVLVDGVPVTNPNLLYGTIGLSNIDRIQVIPPGEAGVRYGTGSLYGVLLIDTRPPGADRTGGDRPLTPMDLQRRSAFDWGRDPQGHPLLRTSAGAFLGNAAGLAAGVAIGRRCISVDRRDQIVMGCSPVGDVTAVLGAMLVPATAAALGAHWGGTTAASRGRLVPALLGAGMMIFPGYAFSMATVGGGSEVANAAGAIMLVLGTPLLVTLADRMFRDLR
jgi:hypothetical protein